MINTPASISMPQVSVIMPIRNEEAFIELSLRAVLGQDYPHDRLEVLLSDGMSTDSTRTIAYRLAAEHDSVRVRILDNPQKIVATGINLALGQAQSDIILRVDGHTIIEKDYVRACVSALERTGADNVGGRMNAVGQGNFGQVVALATSSPFGVGGARFHYSDREEWVDTVYMGAWKKEVFSRIGYFDEEFVRNQDDEFNYRLGAHQGRILLSPSIKSRYYNRSDFRALTRQYFEYGYWKVRVMQKHPRQMRLRQFIPPALVLSLLTSTLLAALVPATCTVLFIIGGAYLVANLTASLWIARKQGWHYYVLNLPFVFALLHFSYGLGFLWGLIRFSNRWTRMRAR